MALSLFTLCKSHIVATFRCLVGSMVLSAKGLYRLTNLDGWTMSILLSILTLGLSATSALASAAFDDAMKLYGQKQYQAAASAFVRVLRDEPANARAAYYAASASYSANNLKQGVSLFWYVVKHFPNSAEASNSRGFLKKIDVNYAADSSNPTVGISLPPSDVTQQGATGVPTSFVNRTTHGAN